MGRKTRHPNELPPALHTVVCADWKQMGVGGDDSWGALTHPEYLLPTSKEGKEGKELVFSFAFQGSKQYSTIQAYKSLETLWLQGFRITKEWGRRKLIVKQN